MSPFDFGILSHHAPPVAVSGGILLSIATAAQCVGSPVRRPQFVSSAAFQVHHWRFRYRFAGKSETVALGTYPVVTLDWARSRQQFFLNLLANGIDPSALRAALGKHRFGVTMRMWEAEQGRMHAGLYFCPVRGVSNPSIPNL
jgi:hypothetical protein